MLRVGSYQDGHDNSHAREQRNSGYPPPASALPVIDRPPLDVSRVGGHRIESINRFNR